MCVYDYGNRFIKIKDSSDNDVAEFAYGGLGCRLKKYDAVSDPSLQVTYGIVDIF